MSAAKKRPVTAARRRLSQILEEINTLVCEFAIVCGEETDVVETLDSAIGDAREMLGDVFDEDVPGYWLIAAKPAMTREQLDAELRARGVGRAS